MSDRGSATVAVMFPIAAVLVGVVGLTAVAMLYGGRITASTAADAAALAAAVASYPAAGGGDPMGAAAELAARNGASVVSCECAVDSTLVARTVEVVVAARVDVPIFGAFEVRAGARAEFDPAEWLGSG